MARSPDEIQADIALTRRQIEHRLDALQRRVEHRWWTPYALVGAGLLTGVLLSRLPLFAVVGGGARALQTGLSVAAALAAVDRFIAERRALQAPAGAPPAPAAREALRRAS